MATGKPAPFKRGLVSLPRVQAGLVPLSSVVPRNVRSLLEDDANCTECFDGRLAFDAWLRGSPRLCGGFLGDMCAWGLVTVGTIIILRSHHTFLWRAVRAFHHSSYHRLLLFSRPRVILSVVLTSFGCHTLVGFSSLVSHQLRKGVCCVGSRVV